MKLKNKDVFKHQEIFEYADRIVKRYTKFYHRYYANNSIDFEDLIQEAHIVVCNLLEQVKANIVQDKSGKILDIDNAVELKRFIGNAVGRRMNVIRKECEKHSLGTVKGEKLCQCAILDRLGNERNDLDGYCLKCGLPIGYKMETHKNTEDSDEPTNLDNTQEDIDITIKEMAEICLNNPLVRKNDFRMLCERVLESRTLQDIANRYHITRAGVRYKINNVCRELRRHYK